VTPDLTKNQRKLAFELRQERRKRENEGETGLVIRRGKIVKTVVNNGLDHSYTSFQGRGRGRGGNSSRGGNSGTSVQNSFAALGREMDREIQPFRL
jgi:hypothetical protein